MPIEHRTLYIEVFSTNSLVLKGKHAHNLDGNIFTQDLQIIISDMYTNDVEES